jgi:hypothetical protein
MLIADIFHSPLDGLYLCPECNHAGNCAGRCPGCSNTLGLLNLGRVLDRAIERILTEPMIPTVAREKRSDTVLTELELQHDCTGPAEANLENAPFISC